MPARFFGKTCLYLVDGNYGLHKMIGMYLNLCSSIFLIFWTLSAAAYQQLKVDLPADMRSVKIFTNEALTEFDGSNVG